MEDDLANFVDIDILREQLAVINNCLSALPPFQISARKTTLTREKENLLRMIDEFENPKRNKGKEVAGPSGHASSWVEPRSASGSSFTSGSRTPSDDYYSHSSTLSRMTTPSTSRPKTPSPLANDTLWDDQHYVQTNQELLDWELAQQLAQEFEDAEQLDEMTERERQAQILADEEFARQIEAAISPVLNQQPTFANNTEENMDLDTQQSSDEESESILDDESRNDGEDIASPLADDATSQPEPSTSYQVEPQMSQQNAAYRNPFIQSNVQIQGDAPMRLVCPQCQRDRSGHRYLRCLFCGHHGTPMLRPQEVPTPAVPLPLPQNFGFAMGGSYVTPATYMQQSMDIARQIGQHVGEAWKNLYQGTNSPRAGQGTSSSPVNLDSSPPRYATPVPLLNNGWQAAYPGPIGNPYNFPQPPQIPIIRMPAYDMPVPSLTNDELKDLLQNIRPDEEIKVEDPDSHIPGLSRRLRLMKHQRMGLEWLKKMEEGKNKGGILADDMGLGKTIQSIALLVSRPSEDRGCKTTLIITPVALLRQWCTEIETKTDPKLKVYIHHASSRSRKARTSSELLQNDVVLTTYNTIAHEYKNLAKHEGIPEEERHNHTPPQCLFIDTKWYRVILDEAQVIKNRNTQAARGACRLKSQYRLSLSGTPMQNSIEEMYSHIAFLKIRPYCEWKNFQKDFVVGLKKSLSRKEGMRKFQVLLKAILLRRTKTSEIDGEPILMGLPEKTIEMVHAVFDQEQEEFYRAFETGAITQMRKYQHDGTLGRNFSHALVLLLRLRQACLHPKLIKQIKKAGSTELTQDQQVVLAKQFSEQAVARIKSLETFECPVCFETVENPSLVLPCGHHYCTECLSNLFDQAREDGLANGDEGREKAKCPGCRGDMDPNHVVSLEAFNIAQGDASGEEEAEEDDDDDDDGDWLYSGDRKRKHNGKEPAKKYQRKPKKDKEEEMEDGVDFVSAAKIEKLCEILEQIRVNDPSEKVIVFSQFTGFLDLLQRPLTERRFNYGRYDGAMTGREREDELERFKSDPNITVFLVSLRAGAYGLNLTCASQCVMLDPFWNPFVEMQAIDRIHRIGQVRPVKVHRIVIQNTVEDRILALQEKKRDIVEGALAEDASRAIARLSQRDLLFLFGIGGG